MIHSITNEETAESFSFTEETLRLMLDHAPDEETKDLLERRVLKGNHLELSSTDFATICYLAARVLLGVKGSGHAA